MADLESGSGRGRRGDMSADTTQTYVRLAEQGMPTGDTSQGNPAGAASERPTGLKKLLRALWPFGRN